MKQEPIVKKYQFSKEEHDKLQNIHIGMVAASAQLDGMQIFKNVILNEVYKRVGIDTKPSEEWDKSINYSLAENTITFTKILKKKVESKEEPKVEEKKGEENVEK